MYRRRSAIYQSSSVKICITGADIDRQARGTARARLLRRSLRLLQRRRGQAEDQEVRGVIGKRRPVKI